ncbi:cytochrome P450 [Fennellomyces sp. T-0311]|nr:cytochrome P450 [Fennellomyces sp. T-0311]
MDNKRLSVTTAAILVATLYYLYNKINKPPKQLRHIPYSGFFRHMAATLQKKPVDQIAKEIAYPLAHQTTSGLYARFDHFNWQVVITNPVVARQFLFDQGSFDRTPLAEHFAGTVLGRFIIGPNILFSTGDQWKNQRKVANPAFHRAMPLQLFGQLTEKLFRVMDVSDNGAQLEVYDLMERWAMDALGQASFGFDFGAIEDKNNTWVRRYHTILAATEIPFFVIFPIFERKFLDWFPQRKKVHQEVTIFLDMIQKVIDRKRTLIQQKAEQDVPDNDKDLLTLMLEQPENDGLTAMTDEEMKSNVCNFFFAGHDTTAAALSFAIYYMAKHPEIQQKAREEAIRVLGNEPQDIIPTLQQTKEMIYLNMVIKETLRMNGPSDSLTPKTSTKDTELGGVFIPKGTVTTISIYEVHHNPKVWENPDTFDPERFAPGRENINNRDGVAWIPFSSGSRQCLGMNLTLAEQRLFLPMLLRKFEWELPMDSPHQERVITQTNLSVLHPVDLKVNFKKRY